MTTSKAHWSEKEQQYWIRDLNGGVLWFDSVLDAQAAARQIEIDNAVKAERDAIVKWLRDDKEPYEEKEIDLAYILALLIERGEHLK
jgi:hypothetical protein